MHVMDTFTSTLGYVGQFDMLTCIMAMRVGIGVDNDICMVIALA